MNSETLNAIDPENHYFDQLQNSIGCNYYSLEDFCEIFSNKINLLNIFGYNVRSFNHNSDTVLTIVEKSRPHVMVFSETWFSEDSKAEIPEYDSYHTIRTERQSGGVSVYVSDLFISSAVEELCYANVDIEVCSVKIVSNDDSFYIIGIYRPHSGTIENFSNELIQILTNQLLKNKKCCLIGDFNINLLIENSTNSSFVETLHSLHFYNLISKPTRFSEIESHSPSLIDHIWLNSLDIVNFGLVSFDTLDHIPMFLQFPFLTSRNNTSGNDDFIKITFRLNNDQNRELFKQKIEEFDWDSLSTGNIHDYFSSFSRAFDNMYCSTFPLKTKLIPKRKANNPWFTPYLNELVKQKSTYFELFRLGVISKNENNAYKNKVKSAIGKAKSMYYKSLFQNNMGNSRATWKTLNDLMGRKRKSCIKYLLNGNDEIHDDKGIADLFNNYFTNIPLTLDSMIPNSSIDPTSFISVNLQSYLSEFQPCTPFEVSSIISNLKITKENKNSVPINLIIVNKDLLSVVISNMINHAMTQCVFPDCLKVARIVPVLKNGDPRITGNYRPIAISPWLSKVFEKILYTRIIDHVAFNDILSPQQFGFRRQTSTLDAIIHFTEFIYENLNNKNSTLSIAIDYSKAFDTVNHDILLHKLECYGVRGDCLQLLASYLRDRRQAVCIRGTYSDYKTTNISVPQGSILGPLLFILYVNEIPTISDRFVATMFADDCTLTFANSLISNLINDCNEDLAMFKLWSDANRLTINASKTNCLFISNVSETPPPGSIFIDENVLNFVSEVKFLGVIIDDQVKYDQHIIYIRKKISKSIGIIYRIKQFIPLSCLRNLYFSLIHPFFLYCLPIFGATYDTHIEPLILLQKRAIRILSNSDPFAHTEPLFRLHDILKLRDLYKYSLGIFAYNNQDILQNFSRSHDHFTRNRDELLRPLDRLRSTEQSVVSSAVKLWVDIPADVKDSVNELAFKMKYKKILISQYST